MSYSETKFKGLKSVCIQKYGSEKGLLIYNNKEIHFNLKSCVYFETVSKYGHPELCTVFCAVIFTLLIQSIYNPILSE